MRISDWSADVCSSDLGHLATTVDVQHRDVAGHQHVLGLAGLAEGEHRVVLDHPDLVGRRFVAHVGETLHSAPDRFVGPAAEVADDGGAHAHAWRSEEHTSELQSLMRISYAVFCLQKKKQQQIDDTHKQYRAEAE